MPEYFWKQLSPVFLTAMAREELRLARDYFFMFGEVDADFEFAYLGGGPL